MVVVRVDVVDRQIDVEPRPRAQRDDRIAIELRVDRCPMNAHGRRRPRECEPRAGLRKRVFHMKAVFRWMRDPDVHFLLWR